jgi:hypothetical protein
MSFSHRSGGSSGPLFGAEIVGQQIEPASEDGLNRTSLEDGQGPERASKILISESESVALSDVMHPSHETAADRERGMTLLQNAPQNFAAQESVCRSLGISQYTYDLM